MRYERLRDIPERERPPLRRRDHLRLDRRRRHQRGRVLGDAEHRVAGEAAARHPGRGQRLRDLGAGRRADAGRRHLAAAARLPRPATSRRSTACDYSRAMRRDAAGGRLRPRAARPGAGPRQGDPALLALALGRREALQDAGGARARGRARSAAAAGAAPAAASASPPPTTLAAIASDVDREIAEAADLRAGRRRSRIRRPSTLYVYSPNVDPGRRRVRAASRRPTGKPDTMVAAINQTLKDEMARNAAHARLRRGRRRLPDPRRCRTSAARAACSR